MRNFRTYQVAVEFYRLTQQLKLPRHLKDQLDRASASIALNLAEGYGRHSKADQKRFFTIAFGSFRECQAVIDLALSRSQELESCADKLAAHLYKLNLKTY